MYVAKIAPNRFKFGITRNVRSRISNLITTGYGRPILIGESSKYCTKEQALKVESLIKQSVNAGEYCSHAEVRRVIATIRKAYGFEYHNPVNTKIDQPREFKVKDKIKLNLTKSVINETTDKCTSSTSLCVLAVAALKQGLARPDVKANETKFSKDGKRYTCINSEDACRTILQFDTDKTKIKPKTVTIEIVKIEDIKSRAYTQPGKRKKAKTNKSKPRARRTRGRDKGLVKYFTNR